MALDLGQRFPSSFLGLPPHISQSDLRLWEVWRVLYALEYSAFYFDVAVGNGEPVPPGTPANLAVAWQRLTRFRADVVGDHGDRWDLLEFRPNAGASAIGALQVYLTLWKEDPPDQREVRGIVVTDQMSDDAKLVARLAGLSVLELQG